MSLSSIASVSIQAGTSQPSRRGFGTPLLLGYHTRFAGNVRTYNSLSGMVSDGFTVNDPLYLMASAVFSQNPRPQQIKVGRLPEPTGVPHTVEIDVAGIASGETITMTVRSPDGTETDISVAFDTNSTTTATNLATALDAITGLAASSALSVVTADADNDGEIFFYQDLVNATILDVTGDWAYDTQLNAILNEDADFYGVAIDVNSDTNVADVAAWVSSNDRIAAFGPQTNDPADYTSTADALMTGDNDRAFSIVKKTSREYFPECAALGAMLPFDPGSQTWSFKRLTGVPTDGWSASEITTIEADNSNHYTSVAELPMLRNGVTHGGEFIDVQRGIDFIKYRLQEDIVAALANQRKIPFTDAGGQQIFQIIERRLLDAAAKGIITADSIVITVPKVADILAADRAARHFSGVEFQATLQGAIHKVTILGTVSV